MDKETRNRIQRATQAARALLEREYAEQLEGTFDVRLDGTIAPEPGSHLDASQRVLRTKIVATVEHVWSSVTSHQSSAGDRRPTTDDRSEAVAGYLREAAFTTLNRFVALKMLEARGLVQECISRGEQSAGFKEFTGLAPGLAQLPDHGYRLYIESLFDEIGREVRVLFDRRDPASLLWPRRQALQQLLDILNDPDLARLTTDNGRPTTIWHEDETIGWVYQYFNSDEERRQMRAESQAPRNSHELAVRNQFFTPRYVVEFLTDNTLGRIWYEMRQGKTRLVDECAYLVRRPTEVFLAEGERAPEEDVSIDENLSQEELLQKPVYIPFRAKKDPPDLKTLDPACGSGHFLLYAFDLLISIYEEAWEDDSSPSSEATGCKLRDDYATFEDLRCALPGLVLRHNLHGIDIDPRAVQIAALALWMRAQRAYNDFGIARGERLPISKTNIVVAEPMPGEKELRQEFIASLDKQLRQLVLRVFEKMELAGEAGSILKIEDEIQVAIRDIYCETGELFRKSDEERWREAEDKLMHALHAYAEQAQNGRAYGRRLFAEDTARGFAFIDLCRQRYDTVLMNPPFGDASNASLNLLDVQLGQTGRDVGGAFLLSAATRYRIECGMVGALLPTGHWFKPVFETLRETLFWGEEVELRCAAHLGGQVLDGATVSASGLVLGNPVPGESTVVLRITEKGENPELLLKAVAETASPPARLSVPVYALQTSKAAVLPGKPFSYWLSRGLRRRLAAMAPFEGSGGTVKQGTATADEFRFTRAWWEVPVGSNWQTFVKSGEYSPFWDDCPWVTNLRDNLREIDATGKARVQAVDFFGRAGVTFPRKSVLGFNPRLHPSGCGFGDSAPVAFAHRIPAATLLAFLVSRPVEYLISLFVGEMQGEAGVYPPHYQVGVVQRLPWPEDAFTVDVTNVLNQLGVQSIRLLQELLTLDETSLFFAGFDEYDSPESLAIRIEQSETQAVRLLLDLRARADRIALRAYGFTASDEEALRNAFVDLAPPAKGKWRVYFGHSYDGPGLEDCARRLLSWGLGMVFGRWSSRALGKTKSSEVTYMPSAPSAQADDPNFGVAVAVDDLGHSADLFSLLHASFSPETTRAIETVLSGIDIRKMLRKDVFVAHVRDYTKGRRKAPIYWQLATPSASYSVWLYYHRFTKDTFYKVLNDYVTPKLQHEERKLTSLLQSAGGSPTATQRKEIAEQEAFVEELRAFREETARIAPLWNPDLNDGVIINFAPLWRLVPQHRVWQKECKDCWDKLVAGDYDWAHLAMHLWPERVVPKCAEDRSLAIAHGLEDVFWVEDIDGKWQPRKVDPATIDRLIKERTSAAVKEALKSLLEAPVPTGRGVSRAKGPRRRSHPKTSGSAEANGPDRSGLAQGKEADGSITRAGEVRGALYDVAGEEHA